MAEKLNKIAEAADFHRADAKEWLELPRIESLPEFYKSCRGITENDNNWVNENWDTIGKIEASREVRLFLIDRGAMNILALAGEASENEDSEVRNAASKKLTERLQSEEGAWLIRQHRQLLLSEGAFVQHLFDDAKFFLKTARFFEPRDKHKSRTFVRASVIAAFTALESMVNVYCHILAKDEDLELHELSFLLDQKLELADEGYFVVHGQRLNRLEDKIIFLRWKLLGVALDKAGPVWGQLQSARKLRNEIVHPKIETVSQTPPALRVA